MNRVLSSCSAALAAACLSSCTAVHPLPDDVTDNTVAIVRKIRCEARDAVMEAIVDHLENSPDQRDKDFGRRLLSDSKAVEALIKSTPGLNISSSAYAYLNQYYTGAIAYRFYLDIQRETENGIGISLIDAFTNHDRRYDVGGGIKREQKALREFQIADKFTDLANLYQLDSRNKPKCVPTSGPDYAYPISGTIGLKETVATFLQLNDMAGVQQGEKAGVTRFTDELIFTTSVSGRLNPKLVFDPVGIGNSNPELGFTNTYKRVDKHQVTISIEVPIPLESKPVEGKKESVMRNDRRASNRKLSNEAERQALENFDLKYQLDYKKKVDKLQ